jgi:hypothetical protein
MSLSNRPQNLDFRERVGPLLKARNQARHLECVAVYEQNPKICNNCSEPIPYKKRLYNLFCNSSCSGSHNNKGRPASEKQKRIAREINLGRRLSEATKKKLSLIQGGTGVTGEIKELRKKKITRAARRKGFPRKGRSPYPYTPVSPCRGCGNYFSRETNYRKVYCDTCPISISTYRARSAFCFNIYDYPNKFPLHLIEQHGWYSPTGRMKRNRALNLSGVSRDHMFSILDGFRRNIEPEILAHPANCCLMLHSENNSKKFRSSITFEELLKKIKEWDNT